MLPTAAHQVQRLKTVRSAVRSRPCPPKTAGQTPFYGLTWIFCSLCWAFLGHKVYLGHHRALLRLASRSSQVGERGRHGRTLAASARTVSLVLPWDSGYTIRDREDAASDRYRTLLPEANQGRRRRPGARRGRGHGPSRQRAGLADEEEGS
jgi:hypothetical protein